MKSHEILKQAIQSIGAKSVAKDMNLSTSLIYKWCQPHDSPDDGGADNPLDRIHKIYELTGDVTPVDWLCEKTGSFRVDNPKNVADRKQPVIRSTQAILKEFSDVLEAVSESYAKENRIDRKEGKRIRKEWEELKSTTESFVAACEQGVYSQSE